MNSRGSAKVYVHHPFSSCSFFQLEALRVSYQQLKDSTQAIDKRNSELLTQQHNKRMREFQNDIRYALDSICLEYLFLEQRSWSNF